MKTLKKCLLVIGIAFVPICYSLGIVTSKREPAKSALSSCEHEWELVKSETIRSEIHNNSITVVIQQHCQKCGYTDAHFIKN